LKLEPGMVGSGDGHDLPAKLQHFFAGKGASHAFIITYPTGYAKDIDMVFEADMRVVHTPWLRFTEDTTYKYWIFKIKDVTEEEINYALDYCIREFASVIYGFWSWPWFVWKWFAEKFLQKDVRKENNWFTKGVICDELWWWFIYKLTEKVLQRLPNSKHWLKLQNHLKEWNPDTIQSAEVKKIMFSFPQIFQFYISHE